MKIKSIHFLAKANYNGNKKSKLIMGLMILLVISLTLISSYSAVITKAVNRYKDDTRARMVEISPCENGIITDDIIDSIKNIDNVVSVSPLLGMRNQLCNILSIQNDDNTETEFYNHENADKSALVWSLIGDEKMDVIAGKSLDDSPVLSCVVPSLFYPFDDNNTDNKNMDYLDGESLLGKTITIKPSGPNGFETLYNIEYTNEWLFLPALEYKLKVVGVCYAAPSTSKYYNSIYVSEETGKLIMDEAFEASSIDLTDESSDVAEWWNTLGLRTHYLVVEDYDKLEETYNNLSEIGISVSALPELGIKESTVIIGNLFKVAGILLTFSSALLCIINLIQSTTLSLFERKGEIGLLKSIGYKNRQIFASMLYEHLMSTIRGCAVGAVISAAVIFTANQIFSHSTFMNRLYIVDWKYYFIFLAISIAIAIIVPLICQLVCLNKLSKIQPREAMN